MNVAGRTFRAGLPATTVVRLGAGRLGPGGQADSDISIQQREPRAIAAILPQVLARYGLSEAKAQGYTSQSATQKSLRQLDLFA